ncbi:MAG: hypothetical protein LBN03_02615 [Bifidobacteriaceae bacterium]|nr:hypothetical protein [Bifidobacteriaceae bacterium]
MTLPYITEKTVRFIVIGDSLSAGKGDSKFKGWVNRVFSRSDLSGFPAVEILYLTYPNSSFSQILDSIDTDLERLIGDSEIYENKIVFSNGFIDVLADQISYSKINFGIFVDKLSNFSDYVLIIGPPATTSAASAESNAKIINDNIKDICSRRKLPFIDLIDPLKNNSQWKESLNKNEGEFPNRTGYQVLSYAILQPIWQDWINQ